MSLYPLANGQYGPIYRASATAAICAAREGRFDLTDRLIAHFPTIATSYRDYQVPTPYMFMIKHLVDIPGAGPSALKAARRLPDIDQFLPPNVQLSDLTAMAAFTAGQDAEAITGLDQVDLQGSHPFWLTPESLIAALDRPPQPGVTPVGSRRRLPPAPDRPARPTRRFSGHRALRPSPAA